MNNIMEYKGYVGSVEFSENDGVFYGKVQGIRSLISYEGTNAKELVSDFHGAVDDYLILCEEEGTAPEIAYKGSFNVRFKNKDNHRRAAIYAMMHEDRPMDMLNFAVASSVIQHTINGDANIIDDVQTIRNLMNMNYDIKR